MFFVSMLACVVEHADFYLVANKKMQLQVKFAGVWDTVLRKIKGCTGNSEKMLHIKVVIVSRASHQRYHNEKHLDLNWFDLNYNFWI